MISAKCQKCRDRAAWIDMFTALSLAIFKTLVGVFTGSMALQAHSLHSFGDFLTKGINLVSVKLSSRPASELFPYGYGKVQFLSAAFIGISLMGGSLVMLWQNVHHLHDGHIQAPHALAVLGALLSAIVAEVMHRYLRCVGDHTNSPAIMAAAADNRGDAYSSLAVLVGVVLSILGWPVADHLAAILVSLLVFRVGCVVAWDAIHGLMDGTVPGELLEGIRAVVAEHDSVQAIVELRGRRMGESWEVDLCLRISENFTTAESHDLAQQIQGSITGWARHPGRVRISFVPG